MTYATRTLPRLMAKARQRNLQVVAGVLVMLASALGGVKLLADARDRVEILIANRTVQPGETITSEDVRIASLSVSREVSFIDASRRDDIVGRVATELLSPGKVITRESFADTAQLPAGYVAMSLALKADQAAAGQLRSGDQVAVISSGSTSHPELGTRILFTDLPVMAVSRSRTDESSVVVTLRLRLEEARALAEAKSTGAIELVLLSKAAR